MIARPLAAALRHGAAARHLHLRSRRTHTYTRTHTRTFRKQLPPLHALNGAFSSSEVSSAQSALGKRSPMFYVPVLSDAVARKEALVTLPEEESKHLKVIRVGEGTAVQLCDGRGRVVHGRVEVVGSKKEPARVRVERIETQVDVANNTNSPAWHVGVACGSLKGSRGDWMVEKCAEIGARSLTPLMTARSMRVGGKDRERYERLAVSVMKQSLQAWKMEVREACDLFEFLDGFGEGARVFVGAESAVGFGDVLREEREERVTDAVVLVGPEGDFTPEELDGLVERGVKPVGLGARRLRTETAAIVMLSTGMVMM